MSNPKLFLSEIKDEYVRENFKKLDDYLKLNQLLAADFRHLEIVVPTAFSDFTFPHGLSFIPSRCFYNLRFIGNRNVELSKI
jgi:hypothetical protein